MKFSNVSGPEGNVPAANKKKTCVFRMTAFSLLAAFLVPT